MKTIYPISICFLLLGSILWAKTGSSKPNVLFISIDDLNDWVGFMDGHPQAKTPHMDRLAKSGRNFTNAHCSVPVCTSSRNSVMSGIGPMTHGSYEIGPKYEELPALADADYYTAEWAILDDQDRLIRGNFSFSFGSQARMPAVIRAEEELALRLRNGEDEVTRFVTPPRTEIILDQEPRAFDPPFTLRLEDRPNP